MKRKFFLLILIAQFSGYLFAQSPWVVPADQSAKLSSTQFSDQSRSAGHDLYMANCKSCHGDPGKNNAVKLTPPPPDPASAQMQQNPDGALHYKISEGRVTMPSFKNALSSADIWNVISFIRSFNPNYTQALAVKPSFGGETFDKVELALNFDEAKQAVVVLANGAKGSLKKPIPGLELKLFAKRYFGNLPLGSAETGVDGKASFLVPANLPSDASGNLEVLATVPNEELFGVVKQEAVIKAGKATYRPPLNEPRAIWNVVSKAPIWLLLSYTLSVLVVWGFIFFVLLQLRKIYKMGEPKKD
ncbi:MAG: cytochrome c [Marinilabiliales bacterium]|nr:cytochrome c [Marinilabiliales bacterium]